MDLLTIILIALALAMDAFAVSIASGGVLRKEHIPNAFKMAFAFGFFQMLMPLIGWSSGIALRRVISGVDHWIAFALLVSVGGKMIYEATKIEAIAKKTDPFSLSQLLLLAIATSIDALAVGITFAFLKVSVLTPVIIIGIITFSLSFCGIFIGNFFGRFFEKKMEIVGGLILIAIGIKILASHL